MRHTAVGVNYPDTYHRGGITHPWPMPDELVVIGFEGVGIVEGVGDGKLSTWTGGMSETSVQRCSRMKVLA